jgi:hypothetical protein
LELAGRRGEMTYAPGKKKIKKIIGEQKTKETKKQLRGEKAGKGPWDMGRGEALELC